MTIGAALHGVVLAGGRGSRLGQSKPMVELLDRPPYSWVADTMQAAGLTVCVVVKPDSTVANESSEWPAVIVEPAEPVHPLLGVATAIKRLTAPVVVCACDMPFVTPAMFAWLAEQDDAEAVVCSAAGHVQPMLGRYAPSLLDDLRDTVSKQQSARSLIERLGERARVIDESELNQFGAAARLTFDIDTPEDLETAKLLLAESSG